MAVTDTYNAYDFDADALRDKYQAERDKRVRDDGKAPRRSNRNRK
jgi:hypothetical protein